MSDDLVNDAEFRAMMQGFARNFWQERVPNFRLLLSQVGSAELKRAVHGLAGTAEMIGEPEIGHLARQAEQLWDEAGAGSDQVRAALQTLSEHIVSRAQALGH